MKKEYDALECTYRGVPFIIYVSEFLNDDEIQVYIEKARRWADKCMQEGHKLCEEKNLEGFVDWRLDDVDAVDWEQYNDSW